MSERSKRVLLVPEGYMLSCPYVYGLEQYGYLNISCPFPASCFVFMNFKQKICEIDVAAMLLLFSVRLGGGGGWGGEGGAMVLGKLPVPRRPTLDDSRGRTYCACSKCGWELFGRFTLIYLFSSLSPSLWETARYRLKCCLKGPLNPKQPTN